MKAGTVVVVSAKVSWASYNTFSTQNHASAETIASAGNSTVLRGKERHLSEIDVVRNASHDRA